ncbi:hypothetical protein GUJ93_ZPchr2169g6443 [Zizania palustris]|uniref:Uncharacterized protein n=1 Tax=Zizania palustris TaxID=103762 RepID=A0A8J5V277_ZIZPA|nr:hypothetical protein GUJ93_ZPchr2169g6443 [Zizania palustris]
MSAIASAAAASSSALEGTANTTSQAEQTRRLADVGAEKLKNEPLEGLHVDRLPRVICHHILGNMLHHERRGEYGCVVLFGTLSCHRWSSIPNPFLPLASSPSFASPPVPPPSLPAAAAPSYLAGRRQSSALSYLAGRRRSSISNPFFLSLVSSPVLRPSAGGRRPLPPRLAQPPILRPSLEARPSSNPSRR